MKPSTWFFVLLCLAFLVTACGPQREEPAVQIPTRTPRPTFTPTPIQPSAPPAQSAADTGTGQASVDVVQPAAQETQPSAAEPAPELPTPTPQAEEAKVVVTSPLVNLRSGPDTAYELLGEAQRGDEFRIVGKNAAGDWWQICCVNDGEVWIAGFLVDTSGPVESVAVVDEIPPLPTQPPTPTPAPVVQAPTEPPTQPTPTPEPAEPTPTPEPAFSVNKDAYVEPRANANPVVTFFGTLCKEVCPSGGAAGGYKLVVEGPHGRSEGTFEEIFRHGDPGLPSEFIYNVKIEIPGGPQGAYKAYVADPSGEQVSEAWEYTSSGDVRTFLPRWVIP